MSKFNSEWLEQYRRNPRTSNILYKNYANPGVGTAYNQPTDFGRNPLVQSIFKQGEQQGMFAGQKEGEKQIRSLVPENMQNMGLSAILDKSNSSYEGNQKVIPQIQQAQQQLIQTRLNNYKSVIGLGPQQSDAAFKLLVDAVGDRQKAVELIWANS